MNTPFSGDNRFYFLGCGNMGKAVLHAWAEQGLPKPHVSIAVATEASAHALRQEGFNAAVAKPYAGEKWVVLAVKPQMLDALFPPLAAQLESAHVITLAAGKNFQFYRQTLGQSNLLIRSMPNTPAVLREGVTGLVADSPLSDTVKTQVTAFFNACGSTFWMQNEDMLDKLAAVAGSGPAYVFHMMEALTQAAQAIGLPEKEALGMVAQTFKGSVALAEKEGFEKLSGLRQSVTSKGGITEAALEVLMPALTPLFENALHANLERNRKLRG